jgi:hypothetical protein
MIIEWLHRCCHTDYGEPIVALKSYMLSPFIDEQHVERLVENVLDARQAVRANEEHAEP